MPEPRTLHHTPEPWVNVGKVGFAIGIYAHDIQVALLHGPTSNPQAEDNARLVVASPKMYRALLAYQALDEQCANCDECADFAELESECCSKCFPFADRARLLMREVLEELHA